MGWTIRWRVAAAAIGTLLLSNGLAEAPSAADPLISHRALYRVTLGEARASGAPISISGRLFYRLQRTCDGWSSENRTRLLSVDPNGTATDNAWSLVGWESLDGNRFRFWTRERDNGDLLLSVEGAARMAAGEAGEASFKEPNDLTMTLPPGTLFPTTYLRLLLDSAAEGHRVLSRPLFDGADANGPVDVNAVIAPARPGRPTLAPLFRAAGLDSRPVWPIRMAFFDRAATDELPIVEMRVDYRADGIGEYLLQDFGRFAIRVELERVERLPAPEC